MENFRKDGYCMFVIVSRGVSNSLEGYNQIPNFEGFNLFSCIKIWGRIPIEIAKISSINIISRFQRKRFASQGSFPYFGSVV